MADFITGESEKYIKDLFEKEIKEDLRYHDILHTEYVTDQSERIGKSSGLSGRIVARNSFLLSLYGRSP